MEFKNTHIFLLCLCTNWRHWRQWFWNFSLYYRQIYPISVFILKFPLHHWTFSLSPHLDSKIASVFLFLSHEDLHRMCSERRGKGCETVWKSGFAYLFASKRLLTYGLSDLLPFWLSNRQSDLLSGLLIDLIGSALLLTNWLSISLVDVVIFLSGWSIQLSSHTDSVSPFFPGWRHWLTSGYLPLWLIHPPELSYWQSVSVLLWLTSFTHVLLSSSLADPPTWALILTECLSSSLADVTDWQLVVFQSVWSTQPSSVTTRVSDFFCG